MPVTIYLNEHLTALSYGAVALFSTKREYVNVLLWSKLAQCLVEYVPGQPLALRRDAPRLLVELRVQHCVDERF